LSSPSFAGCSFFSSWAAGASAWKLTFIKSQSLPQPSRNSNPNAGTTRRKI
jgi:hypothetical protein